MKMSLFSFLCILFPCLFIAVAGCIQNPYGAPAPVPGVTSINMQENYTSNGTLVAFVERAVAYTKTHGTKNALAEFNRPDGSFRQGELYIYAYGFNGTTLAHPVNPESVGKPREGANGVFVREMGESVRNGSGFYRFVYANPEHNRTLESKLGYGAAVDDTWWLGSGIYTGPAEPSRK
jgi:signal transduction histidine kinase